MTSPFDWAARAHPEVRRRTEEREERLSRFAARSRESADRDRPEPPDPMRTAFQIDAVLCAANTAMRMGDDDAADKACRIVEGILG